MRVALHWFRRDLRLADNTSLTLATRRFDLVLPVFVLDPALLERGDMGAPRVAFLLDTLAELAQDLERAGLPLIVRRGEPARELALLAAETNAVAVSANRDYSPYARRRDARVKGALREAGVEWLDWKDQVLIEPAECVKDDGMPYTVFTPYARRWRLVDKEPPFARLRLRPAEGSISLRKRGKLPSLRELGLTLDAEIEKGGAKRARARLDSFVRSRLASYASQRDAPALEGTSGLSPHLKFGTISPRQVFARVADAIGADLASLDPARPSPGLDADARHRLREGGTFLTEICWREFYQMILFHFPHVASGPFQARYADLRWPEKSRRMIDAWRDGRTGFPIVDAGMRQLAATGWMHNRLRMITAAFLIKTLLVDWRVGERIFMQRLTDGDLAANNGGWQWSASTGTDAAPYFRIFNPMKQSQRWDPEGDYLRRWIPELRHVKAPLIHDPSRDPATLRSTGYPAPIVDYAERRHAALELFKPRR